MALTWRPLIASPSNLLGEKATTLEKELDNMEAKGAVHPVSTMEEVRGIVDGLEAELPEEFYPMPTYLDILMNNNNN
jgi:glutamine synthetase type III